jgi:hypothetical protein
MKRSTACLLIFAAVACLLPLAFDLDSVEATDQSVQVGRYVLETGEYLAPTHAAERRVPGVFKIDTATGQVWRYTGRVAGKERVEEWVAISD